jgi:hypothetical protein
MRRGVPLLLPAILFGFAGCSSEAPKGTITGSLMMVGGPSDSSRPIAGTVTVTEVGAGTTSVVVQVAADGAFSAQVPAGSYTLAGTSPLYGDGAYPCRGENRVPVQASSSASADVVCSVK